MIEILNNPKYKKIYLSGPITGIENLNKEAFEFFKQKFIKLDFEVVNPHDLFTKEEVEEANRKLLAKEITEEEFWAYFMKRDIAHLVTCDLVAVLPNWQNSKGARVETGIATDIYIPIIDAETLNEIF